MANTDLTAEQLRQRLDYNPSTGHFTYTGFVRSTGGKMAMGKRAGCVGHIGYRVLKIGRYVYLEHRLAFLWMEGEHPPECVDHINGDRSDNRWENLRHAPRKLNNQNVRKPQANNTTGFLGVTWDKRRKVFVAQITSGRTYRLGDFDNAEDAHKAYVEAKRNLHEGCTL